LVPKDLERKPTGEGVFGRSVEERAVQGRLEPPAPPGLVSEELCDFLSPAFHAVLGLR
jgi:hypothetical protein